MLSFLKNSLMCVHVRVRACVWVFLLLCFLCATFMQCPRKAEEGIRYPRTEVTDGSELPCGFWELNSGSEPPLHPQHTFLSSWWHGAITTGCPSWTQLQFKRLLSSTPGTGSFVWQQRSLDAVNWCSADLQAFGPLSAHVLSLYLRFPSYTEAKMATAPCGVLQLSWDSTGKVFLLLEFVDDWGRWLQCSLSGSL